jgi:DNA-binding NtrC family response regulator
MFMQSNNFGSSEGILKHNQLEALKSLSLLLVREINSLDETQANLKKEIESEKPINLFEELKRFEAKMIRCALIRSMGKQRTAAKLLGIKETTLTMKIKRFKIDLTEPA